MESITWRLLDGGRLLEIYRIDPQSRKMSLMFPLRVRQPMTDADAQKYIDNNYPPHSSAVRQAAEILSTKRQSQ